MILIRFTSDFKNDDAGDVNDESRYLTPTQLADLYCSFIEKYPIVSIEGKIESERLFNHFFKKIPSIRTIGKDMLTLLLVLASIRRLLVMISSSLIQLVFKLHLTRKPVMHSCSRLTRLVL